MYVAGDMLGTGRPHAANYVEELVKHSNIGVVTNKTD